MIALLKIGKHVGLISPLWFCRDSIEAMSAAPIYARQQVRDQGVVDTLSNGWLVSGNQRSRLLERSKKVP